MDIQVSPGAGKNSLGGEVYAIGEMVDHMSLLQDCYGLVDGLDPGMAGLADSETFVTYLKTKKMLNDKYSARHFLRIQQAFGEGELDNVHWVPGTGNPADGSTKVRSDMAPLSTSGIGPLQSWVVKTATKSALEGISGPWGAREFLLRAHTQVGGNAVGPTGRRRGPGCKIALASLFCPVLPTP